MSDLDDNLGHEGDEPAPVGATVKVSRSPAEPLPVATSGGASKSLVTTSAADDEHQGSSAVASLDDTVGGGSGTSSGVDVMGVSISEGAAATATASLASSPKDKSTKSPGMNNEKKSPLSTDMSAEGPHAAGGIAMDVEKTVKAEEDISSNNKRKRAPDNDERTGNKVKVSQEEATKSKMGDKKVAVDSGGVHEEGEPEKVEVIDAIRDRPVRKRKQKPKIDELEEKETPRRQSTGSRRVSSGRGRGVPRGGAGRGAAQSSGLAAATPVVANTSVPIASSAPVLPESNAMTSSRGTALQSPPRSSSSQSLSYSGGGSGGGGNNWVRDSSGTMREREGRGGSNRPTVVTDHLDSKEKADKVELVGVFSDIRDIQDAYRTVAGIIELQRQASNGMLEASFSTPAGSTGDGVYLPEPAEISDTLKLVEGSRDILWNALMEVRRKQIVLDSVISARSAEANDTNNIGNGASNAGAPPSASNAPSSSHTSGSAVGFGGFGALPPKGEGKKGGMAAAQAAKEKQRRRLQDVYGIQIQNSLKITESHIYSTIINNKGMLPVDASRHAGATAHSSKSRSSETLNVNAGGGSNTATNSPAFDKGPPPTPGPTKFYFSEQIKQATGAVDANTGLDVHRATPGSLEDSLIPQEDFEKKRARVALIVRDKKMSVRRAWEQLADTYLDVKHHWDAHINEVEAEEEEKEKNGPRLRGSYRGLRPSTDDSGGTLFAVLGQTESLSGGVSASGRASTGGLGLIGGEGGLGSPELSRRNSLGSFGGGLGGPEMGGIGPSSSLAGANLQRSISDGGLSGRGLGQSAADELGGIQDKELLEAIRKENLERRINRCTSKIPDMRSAWQWPDSKKAPVVAEFPQDLREITIEKRDTREKAEKERKRKERERNGEESDDDDDDDGEDEEKEEEEDGKGGEAVEQGGGEESARGEEQEVAGEASSSAGADVGSSDKADVDKKTSKASTAEQGKSSPRSRGSPGIVTKRQRRGSFSFPAPVITIGDLFNPFGSRLTSDGRRQLCGDLPLSHPCFSNCNCARRVDNISRYDRVWSDMEKVIFVDKFLQFPKNFSRIASFLTNRSTKDCIKFYYDSKTVINYKALLKESDSRRRQLKMPWQQALASAASVGATLYPLGAFLERAMLNPSRELAKTGGTSFDEAMYARDFMEVSCEHMGDSVIELPPDENSFHSFFNHPPFMGNALHVEQVPDVWDQKLRPAPRHATIMRALRCMQEAERQRLEIEETRIAKEAIKFANKAAKAQLAGGNGTTSGVTENGGSPGSGVKKGGTTRGTEPLTVRRRTQAEQDRQDARASLYAVSGQMLQQGVVNGAMTEVVQDLREAGSSYAIPDTFQSLQGLRQKTPFPKGTLGAHRRVHQPQLYEYSHTSGGGGGDDDSSTGSPPSGLPQALSGSGGARGVAMGGTGRGGAGSMGSSPRTVPASGGVEEGAAEGASLQAQPSPAETPSVAEGAPPPQPSPAQPQETSQQALEQAPAADADATVSASTSSSQKKAPTYSFANNANKALDRGSRAATAGSTSRSGRGSRAVRTKKTGRSTGARMPTNAAIADSATAGRAPPATEAKVQESLSPAVPPPAATEFPGEETTNSGSVAPVSGDGVDTMGAISIPAPGEATSPAGSTQASPLQPDEGVGGATRTDEEAATTESEAALAPESLPAAAVAPSATEPVTEPATGADVDVDAGADADTEPNPTSVVADALDSTEGEPGDAVASPQPPGNEYPVLAALPPPALDET